MSDLSKKLTETWQIMRAGRMGMSEGLNHFVGGAFDGVAYGIGWVANKSGLDVDRQKGVLSGTFFKESLNKKARDYVGYNPKTETPEMESIRIGTSRFVEGGLILGSFVLPALSLSTHAARIGGTAAGVSVGALDMGGQIAQGFEREMNKSPEPRGPN